MEKLKIEDNKINWICLGQQCPESCCGAYEPDTESISLWDVEERWMPLTDDDHELFSSEGYTDHLIQGLDGGWYIQTSRSGECPFLKNNKCSIYKDRPTTCRAYPFYFHQFNGLCVHISCPGWGKGWTDIEVVKEMVSNSAQVYLHQIEKAKRKLNLGKL